MIRASTIAMAAGINPSHMRTMYQQMAEAVSQRPEIMRAIPKLRDMLLAAAEQIPDRMEWR
jgi:hypothetical protein